MINKKSIIYTRNIQSKKNTLNRKTLFKYAE